MTDTRTRNGAASVDDLLTLVSRVADQARPGEELEVYASRGVETDVRAYDGEIEQLSSAASAGVGIRVVSAQRQGFAYAGTLDEEAIAETLAEARDNATFATPDEHLGLARPDTVVPASLDLWDDSLSSLSTSAKVDMALELERRFTKQQILELYANEIYLGNRGSFAIHGFGEASLAYFNKDVREVSLPEAAFMAGIIHAPSTIIAPPPPRMREEFGVSGLEFRVLGLRSATTTSMSCSR